jgi:hypothetical protein
MRTTIDIPDETYRKLKVKAAIEGDTLRQIVLRAIQAEIEQTDAEPARRITEPILKSYAPGSIRIEEREQSFGTKELEMADQSSREPQNQFELPVIRSTRLGSQEIDDETTDEIIGFP